MTGVQTCALPICPTDVPGREWIDAAGQIQRPHLHRREFDPGKFPQQAQLFLIERAPGLGGDDESGEDVTADPRQLAGLGRHRHIGPTLVAHAVQQPVEVSQPVLLRPAQITVSLLSKTLPHSAQSGELTRIEGRR